MAETDGSDKSPRSDGRLTVSERIGAVAAAVFTSAAAGLALWGFIYLSSRKPEPKSIWDIPGAAMQQATDQMTAMLCLGVAMVFSIFTPVFIFWSLLQHRPDDKPDAGKAPDQ